MRSTAAYLNRIATAVPPHDVHSTFLRFAEEKLGTDSREARVFRRMVQSCGIEHRYSFLEASPCPGTVDGGGFYAPGRFPGTAERMRFFEAHAASLAVQSVEALQLGADRSRISHLLLTCCTGFSAPGIDLAIVTRCRLPETVERSVLGFMGCYAAINALKLARHIVRSEPEACVLVVSLELCTLHLKETIRLDEMLSFLLWGDGAAACVVSAAPDGLELKGFGSMLAPGTDGLMRWTIRDHGFDMWLAGAVPSAIAATLRERGHEMIHAETATLWAVHPGGRSILDAVESALELDPRALTASRAVLRRFGNMSSATILFVLAELMRGGHRGAGYAMSFGPGLVAEMLYFRTAS